MGGVAVLVGVAGAIAVLLFLGTGFLASARWGRIVLLVGAALLPLLASAVTISQGVKESSKTEFCLSCHEMEPYGQSLFVDDSRSLAAAHYQNRLISRDSTCYSCHTDYAMFGDVKAKLNGLRHVWAHYSGAIPPPGQIKLYNPYPNYNCLHCHEDGRRFIANPAHASLRGALHAGTTSCLSCHRTSHDFQKVKAGDFWTP